MEKNARKSPLNCVVKNMVDLEPTAEASKNEK
jgi:hypothetical protein